MFIMFIALLVEAYRSLPPQMLLLHVSVNCFAPADDVRESEQSSIRSLVQSCLLDLISRL